MPDLPLPTLVDVWLVLGVLGGYQFLLQINTKGRERYHEGFVKTLQYLIGIPALGSLVFFLADPDRLSSVFIPLPLFFHPFGLLLFDAAASVILWSHVVLGRFWSGELETVHEHPLIHSGPYAFVRHPLYSSYLVLTVGFFLATANWLVGGLMLAYFLAVAARAQREEDMLLIRLGTTYSEYCNRTPRFFPGRRGRANCSPWTQGVARELLTSSPVSDPSEN